MSEQPPAQKPRPRILLVDDDENLLKALKRLHGRTFDLTTVNGPIKAIQAVQQDGPFAVVFSDYQMPGLKGSACLAKIQSIAPETVRVLMTGNNDLGTAVDAINRGAIFRFLQKPCDEETFARCAHDAIRQHELLRGEKDLLENTLKSSVQVMSEILSLTYPRAFGRSDRVVAIVQRVLARRQLPDAWKVETASMLFQIGLVAVPNDIVESMHGSGRLQPEQRALLARHPAIGSGLIRNIPRLEDVATIVQYQTKHFDGSGLPTESAAGNEIPVGARILHGAIALADRLTAGENRNAAVEAMAQEAGRFDPEVLQDLAEIELPDEVMHTTTISIRRLVAGHVLDQDIVHSCGSLIVPKGQRITDSMLARLRSYADLGHIDREVAVLTGADADVVAS